MGPYVGSERQWAAVHGPGRGDIRAWARAEPVRYLGQARLRRSRTGPIYTLTVGIHRWSLRPSGNTKADDGWL
ncbi:hypothetical protein V6N12_050250 [Hibiscus sabdariffa]|uniref:Uncharacterized protein n=1 Tax=Hibiscus sabdariffa TaxID=183260 RepID=A0ABR2GBV5_9ROSI